MIPEDSDHLCSQSMYENILYFLLKVCHSYLPRKSLEFPSCAFEMEEKLKLWPTVSKRQHEFYIFNPVG